MDTLLYLLAFIFDNKKLHLENKKIFQVKSSQQIYVIGNIHGCKDLLERIPVGKIGKPEDIAYTALFLASNEASYITGQTITVDGGRVIN